MTLWVPEPPEEGRPGLPLAQLATGLPQVWVSWPGPWCGQGLLASWASDLPSLQRFGTCMGGPGGLDG